MKILITDDNIENIRRLRGILKEEPLTILETDDADQAYALATRERPHLMIISVELQEREGYRLCARLKRSRETADIPILLLSRWDASTESVKGLDMGAIDYISQPFKKRQLLTKIRKYQYIQHLSEVLFRTRLELQEKERETEESLQSAAIIQQSLLPVATPTVSAFEFAWQFIPCEWVGGDLFNVFKLDETHLGAYIIDVSGHGVPAAMVTTSVAQVLNPLSGQVLKRLTTTPPYYELAAPAEVLDCLNREFPIERFGRYLTICYLILDAQSGRVRYSNAAHPLPLLIRADGQVEKLGSGGTIIGIGGEMRYEEGEACMADGDRLFLYTDGIVEYPDGKGEFYGEDRLVQQLQILGDETLHTACTGVINALRRFGGGRHACDDITLLGIQYRQPAKPAAG
jgi:sigma-B regulation protein RsbU (phosphoserine phosphatase)